MSIPWPATMPASDSKKFGEMVSEDPAVDFKTEGGYRIGRPRYTRRPPRVFQLGFTDLTQAQVNTIFQLFDDAAGSSEIISGWTHPTTGEVLDVRFQQGSKPEAQYKGAGTTFRYDVSGFILEEI